jgi:formate--tetrahydrofolate ligase
MKVKGNGCDTSDRTGIIEKPDLKDIRSVAETVGLNENDLVLYGSYKAKIRLDAIRGRDGRSGGKLVLVTATTPTPFGEGKTTISIGLSMALWKEGKSSIVSLREPSMGPVFGIKGGATGGGRTMVHPMDEINLHFTGDIHAVGSAHNLLSAVADASVFHGNTLGIDASRMVWPRTIDMNDRTLRKVIIGLNPNTSGPMREDSFVITPASEVMAILGLSRSFADLRERLGNIFIGPSHDKQAVCARDLRAEGAMAALLKDALQPNLVQTSDGTPAIIHTGPFGNIAHGTCSVTAIEAAMALSDYAVVEAGFASDLGAEKFMNIITPQIGRVPDIAVIVTTVRSMKFHGGVSKGDLGSGNPDAVARGYENLRAHVRIVREVFGLPAVVAVNRFPSDTDAELEMLCTLIEKDALRFAVADGFSMGAGGLAELAREVVQISEHCEPRFTPVYQTQMPLLDKIDAIAKRVYGAREVEYTSKAMRSLELSEKLGFGNLFVCMAKTQYSISDQASLKGYPRDFRLKIDDVRVKSGAGFIVPICGDIMEMPGLSREPAARNITIDDGGTIAGLY